MGESLVGEIFWGRSGDPFPRLISLITSVLFHPNSGIYFHLIFPKIWEKLFMQQNSPG
jgi:hypothetical protein